MKQISQVIPEIKNADTPANVPFKDAVVWIYPGTGTYFWIEREHVSSVTWTNGNISIVPKMTSIVSTYFTGVVISGATVFVGANIVVS